MAVVIRRTNSDLSGMVKSLTRTNRGVAVELLKRGYRVEAQAKRNVTKTTYSGNLRSSIHTDMYVKGGLPIVRVGTPVSYAPFIHNGTRGHGPVRANAMSWFGPDGRIITAKYVRGINANPFLSDALRIVG